MQSIVEHKFPDARGMALSEFTLDLPAGAKLLQPRAHGPQPMMVVLGDPKAEKEKRMFRLYPRTATTVQPEDQYIGSFELGGFPYHVFEVRAKDAKRAAA